MKYISTRDNKKTYNFIDIFLNGLAHDGGLYIPKIIPRLSNATLQKFSRVKKFNLIELYHGPTLAFKDIAMQVIGNMYQTILSKNKKKN